MIKPETKNAPCHSADLATSFIKYPSEHKDGSLMYPGVYQQLWVRIPATRCWICVDTRKIADPEPAP